MYLAGLRRAFPVCFLLLLLCSWQTQAKKFEHLAMTPPMGWNSWNHFGCKVDEKIIREMADAMVKTGMKDAGYEYINIDDCWHGERDERGFIHPNPEHFPNGMKALADYVHKKGLKLGIYSDAGWKTCGGKPGSRGYEYQDALTYAEWGIDYLKYDWCDTEGLKAEGAYQTMREAIYKAGRPMVFSICEWGDNDPWDWAKDVGHLWRTTGDIYNCFDCEHDHGTWSSWGVLQILDMQDGLRKHAGPGHWNDPDMMEVGNGMTEAEDRAHFSMWAMLAAPLIAGNDLRKMSETTRKILTNKAVIAVDQDKLGIQGFKYKAEKGVEIWFKPLSEGEWAMAVLNRNKNAVKFEFRWRHEPVKDELTNRSIDFNKDEYLWSNLWTDETGSSKKFIRTELEGHDILMLRLVPNM